MKVQEFRIGNLVNDEETTHIVTGIDEWCVYSYWQKDLKRETLYKTPISQIKPILLTEEWLLKFGFKQDGVWFNFQFGFYDLGISKDASGYNFTYDDGFINLQYVHQLQNLYFALTGLELQFCLIKL